MNNFIWSKHNLFSRIKNSEQYYLINLLSRSADILTKEKADEILRGEYSDIDQYITKGYLVDVDEENQRFRQNYLDFLDKRENDEMQIFFVPWYTCNFNCSYCYQNDYSVENTLLKTEVIDSFFSFINKEWLNRKKYITLFGGEPLLPGEEHRSLIEYFLTRVNQNQLDYALVTNGYHLKAYLDILSSAPIREIQVTLDGTETVHNQRRPHQNQSGSFKLIIDGIDASLTAGYPINFRVVLDQDNIDNLPHLARFAIEKGWTKNPQFKTQLGRNYELHHCQSERSRLFSRIELYRILYEMVQTFPEILEFHQPAFSLSRFLFENGELPDPLFDACPGCKTEWAFDYSGRIYSCTATVGKIDESVGQFYPKIEKSESVIENWQKRDIIEIHECQNCSAQLVCGGGCAIMAKKITGRLNGPDCRPVKELLELGISHYFIRS